MKTSPKTLKVDTRIVCGARCTWWNTIYEAKRTETIPLCPHCGGPLYEFKDLKDYMSSVPRYEAAGHQGYSGMLWWAKGRCFKNIQEAANAYEAATGIRVPNLGAQ